MLSVGIIGSTGKVGTTALEVISLAKNIEVVYLCGGYNYSLLLRQISSFKPKYASLLPFRDSYDVEKKALTYGTKLFCDFNSMDYVVQNYVDIAILAVAGNAGIISLYYAMQYSKCVAVANKESFVSLGSYIHTISSRFNAKIFPIDSEHHSIYCLLKGLNVPSSVQKINITCSGGPFLFYTKEKLNHVSFRDASNHPVWKMGWQNTINSATLVNKGLEFIEAYYLFSCSSVDDIGVIIHPECFIHGFVTLYNGLSYHIGYSPNMRVPFYDLFNIRYKDTQKKCEEYIFSKKMTFYSVDHERFPAILLAHRSLTYPLGGSVYSYANEYAINLFKVGKIKFLDIYSLIEYTLDYAMVHYKDANIDLSMLSSGFFELFHREIRCFLDEKIKVL